jgi:hypothetical protein
MDLISYCKTLKPEDWQKKVNSKWTVKDVIAHMVGWEKAATEALAQCWLSKKSPWFLETSKYSEFNAKSVEHYKNYSPNELLAEWQIWQAEMDKQIKEIGEVKLRAAGSQWSWVFDEDENSHSLQHYLQIKKALNTN